MRRKRTSGACRGVRETAPRKAAANQIVHRFNLRRALNLTELSLSTFPPAFIIPQQLFFPPRIHSSLLFLFVESLQDTAEGTPYHVFGSKLSPLPSADPILRTPDSPKIRLNSGDCFQRYLKIQRSCIKCNLEGFGRPLTGHIVRWTSPEWSSAKCRQCNKQDWRADRKSCGFCRV